jgi:anti-sigma factor (TIGR02949 family)
MTNPLNPPDCASVARALYDYLDDELTPDRLEAIKGHLTHCTGCTEHVDFARQLLDQLAAMPVDAAQVASLTERVRAALRAEAAKRS